MLRFAILKHIGAGEGQVVLEYDENQILSRLQARVRENLSEREKFVKHSFKKDEVNSAVEKAFFELVAEFKDKTVALK